MRQTLIAAVALAASLLMPATSVNAQKWEKTSAFTGARVPTAACAKEVPEKLRIIVERNLPYLPVTDPLLAKPLSRISLGGTAFQSPQMRITTPLTGGIPFRGAILSGNSGIQRGAIYQYPLDRYAPSMILDREDILPIGGGAMMHNVTLNGVTYPEVYFYSTLSLMGSSAIVYQYVYNAETWTSLGQRWVDIQDAATDMAWDETSDRLFGCFFSSDGSKFQLVEYNPFYNTPSGSTTTRRRIVCDLPKLWAGCAFDKFGKLYAVDEDGVLFRVDVSDGKMTRIGDTGVKSQYTTSAIIDKGNGLMYLPVASDNEHAIYAIDLSNAQATKLYDNTASESIGGVFPTKPQAAAKAPAPVTALSCDFQNGSKTGAVKFRVPRAYADGSRASGKVNYLIRANGLAIGQGETTYGASANIECTVPENDTYKVIVTLSNDAGTSDEVSWRGYLGTDMPMPISKVNIAYSDGKFRLSWTAPTRTQNNGWFDPANMSYSLTRLPDYVKVADNLKDTVYQDPVSEPDKMTLFRYAVTLYYDGQEVASTQSDDYALGNIVPPHKFDFRSIYNNGQNPLGGFTIIDANNDGNSWIYWHDQTATQRDWAYCYYNDDMDQDDWLITPSYWLEAGTQYTYSFIYTLRNSYNPASIEWFIGQEPTVAGMTQRATDVMRITDTGDQDPTPGSFTFTVPETGKYYVGVHDITEKDRFGIYLWDLEISKGAKLSAPGLGELSAVADPDGALKASISFKCPDKTVDGKNLANITKVSFLRDGEEFYSTGNINPGEVVKATDNKATDGIHTYTAVACNAAGESPDANCKIYVGVNVPGAPANLKGFFGENDGQVIFNWEAPKMDVDRLPMSRNLIKYMLGLANPSTGQVQIFGDNLPDTIVRANLVDPSTTQQFMQFAVFSKSSKGYSSSSYALSPLIAVGESLKMPYRERFSGGRLQNLLGTGSSYSAARWSVSEEYDTDGTGGALVFNGYSKTYGMILTGRIDVQGTDPTLAFTYWDPKGEQNDAFVIEASEDGVNYEEVQGLKLSSSPEEAWITPKISLKKYIGKKIQLRIVYYCVNCKLIIDDIKVYDRFSDNLVADAVSAPNEVEPDRNFNITVRVINDGDNDYTDGASVSLMRNGERIAERGITAIGAHRSGVITFTDKLPVVLPDQKAVYSAQISYAADLNPADNKSGEVNVAIKERRFPEATNLNAEKHGDLDVSLTWDEPQFSSNGISTVTDDLESYKSSSIGLTSSELKDDNIGEWATIDGDGYETTLTQGIPAGAFPNYGKPFAYILLNPYEPFSLEDVGAWTPHSGKKAFVAFANSNGKQNDDWLISPLLSGNAQTIRFFAKSVTVTYGNEEFEILYSKSGTAREDFVSLAEDHEVPADWKEYTYQIPEGAKYFAVRCISTDRFGFMLDDFTFEKGDPYEGLVINGYNVYRDYSLLNAETVKNTSYIDAGQAEKKLPYVVTVVYNRGESAPTAPVILDYNGVEQNLADGVKVSADNGELVIRTPREMDVAIAASDGKLIRSLAVDGRASFPLQPGIYLVRINKRTYKIILK